MRAVRPYGSWPSPLTAADVAAGSPRIDGARFSEARAELAKFSQVMGAKAEFVRAELADARFDGAVLPDLELSEAKLDPVTGFDFTAVSEYLGRPVTLSVEDIAKAADEIRALRDLGIAKERRQANICLRVLELAGPALDKYAKIRELME